MIRVRDLKRYTAGEPRPLLLCPTCGLEVSADAGDYWAADPEVIIKCEAFEHDNAVPMRLVYKRTVYERADVAGPGIE